MKASIKLLLLKRAKILFESGFKTKTEICKYLKVSKPTLDSWIKKNDWIKKELNPVRLLIKESVEIEATVGSYVKQYLVDTKEIAEKTREILHGEINKLSFFRLEALKSISRILNDSFKIMHICFPPKEKKPPTIILTHDQKKEDEIEKELRSKLIPHISPPSTSED